MQITNLHFQVFNKTTGAPILPTALPNNALWSGFGGVCESTNHGDPIVLYDQFSDRWLLSQFSIDGPYHQCIAISQTGDPTGAWYRYDYLMSNTVMNDYPKFGVWGDGYYMSINQFLNASSWAGQGVAAFDKAAMLTGAPAAMIYLDLNASHPELGAMLPADADGATPPPAGTPNYFVQMDDNAWGYPQDQLQVYEFHADFTTPANSTFTVAGASPLAVTPFTTLNRTTVPQPGTAQKLDNLGDRLMYRLQYRNFGTYQSMVVNHTVDTTGAGDGVAGIRWYELRKSSGNWGVQQQGTYAGDAVDDRHRWMGSIAQDSQGNMALGYSVANGSDTYPSIRYTGRLAGDAAGTLPQGEASIIAGGGSQTGSAARWGDYSMMSVDPVDDCTFWYTQEYYATTSNTGWQTRIASFKFPSCTAGPSGRLAGMVSDAAAAPLAGATVAVDNGGGVQLSTTTAADGTYAFAALPTGTYTVSAAKYGYATHNAHGIVISNGATTTQDFNLASLPLYTVSGVVRDVATNWPLYAKVDHGHGFVWTNPATGAYSVDLPEGPVALTVTADHYAAAAAAFTLTADTTQNFAMIPDATCTAPGYHRSTVLTEDFNGCALPSGWTINNLGGDCQWQVTNPDPGDDGNNTGGTGCFADADIDFCGNGTTMDTELITPVVDCSGLTAVTLEFKYDLDDTWLHSSTYNVDISTNGGATWTNVWTRAATAETGTAIIDITAQAAGQSNVKVRFHYLSADWDYWWQVDDVAIYSPVCQPPTDGGLVVGNVYDANTSAALNGALVDDGAGHTTSAVATPDDDNLDDGFYSLFVPASGAVNLTASKDRYQPVTTAVTVPALGTVSQAFHLPTGQLSANPASFEVHVAPGSAKTVDLSLTNNGGASADFRLNEIYAAPPVRPNGPFANKVRHVSPKHLHDTDASRARYDFPPPAVPVIQAGEVVQSWPSGLAYPWGIDHQNPTATLWLGNIAYAGGDDLDYEYSQAGAATGNTIAVASIGATFMADFTYDWANQTLWQVAAGGDNCVHELDPVTKTITGAKICPAFGTDMRGLAYNPKTDTFYAGSWNDSTIHEFDRTGAILRSTNVGLAISGLAFNPSADHLFVMVNGPASGSEVYVVTVPETGDFVVSGQFNIAGFTTDYGGAGLAMDCAGNLWAVDQNSQTVYQVESGEASSCALDIPWLTVAPASGTVAGGAQAPVDLTLNAAGYNAGDIEQGYLKTVNSTPYGSFNIPVTMVVEPDQTLTVSRAGSGAGTVTANLGAINCGATCSDNYPYNTAVTLTATPEAGSTFLGWTGDCNGSTNTCTVTMNQARTVGASFASDGATDKDLAVGVTGSGAGGVTSTPAGINCGALSGTACTASFTVGSMVSLSATAVAGSTFMGWGGACTGNGASCTVTMDQARYVSATFTDTASPTVKELAVTPSGNGLGSVTSAPTGIFCGDAGSTCTAPFDNGVTVVLTASSTLGSSFTGWSGACAGSGSTCTVTMSQNRSVTASFAATDPLINLSVTKTGKGAGTVMSDHAGINCGADCGETYDYGTTVILTATPDQHSALEGWTGSCSEPVTVPPALTCTVRNLQDETVIANFKHVFPWPMFLPAITGKKQ